MGNLPSGYPDRGVCLQPPTNKNGQPLGGLQHCRLCRNAQHAARAVRGRELAPTGSLRAGRAAERAWCEAPPRTPQPIHGTPCLSRARHHPTGWVAGVAATRKMYPPTCFGPQACGTSHRPYCRSAGPGGRGTPHGEIRAGRCAANGAPPSAPRPLRDGHRAAAAIMAGRLREPAPRSRRLW